MGAVAGPGQPERVRVRFLQKPGADALWLILNAETDCLTMPYEDMVMEFESHRTCFRHLAILVLVTMSPLTLHEVRGQSEVSYVKDVAPLLRTYCVGCHGPDSPEADLALHSAGLISTGGKSGAVINRDKPADSLLLKVIESAGDDHMPPPDEPQPSSAERRVLRTWIEAGAAYDGDPAMLLQVPSIPSLVSRVPPIRAVRLAANASTLVTASHQGVRLFNAEQVRGLQASLPKTGLPVLSLPAAAADLPVGDAGKLLDADISADGSLVVVGTGIPGLSGKAVLFRDGALAATFSGHSDVLYAARISPDGKRVATAGYDRRILIHDLSSGTVQVELKGHNGAVFDLDFSPDGTLIASASADGTVKVWSVSTGERLDTLSQPLAEQYRVRFTRDGNRILAVGADSRIRMWQVVSRTQAAINPLLVAQFAHEGAIENLALSRDHQWVATSSEDGVVKIWDSETLTEQAAFLIQPQLATALVFDESSLWIALSDGSWRAASLPEAPVRSRSAADDTASAGMISRFPDQPLHEIAEQEPNNNAEQSQPVAFPTVISGVIQTSDEVPDSDLFRFAARKDQPVLLEVRAARDKSPLDSRIEVLTTSGEPVLRTRLQAVRDSYFTFRGKDSDTIDDFRLFNWQEMDLNQYLYADGEVVRLWLWPRGPDSGFKVYPGFGRRYTWFDTTATSHPLQGPAFIVEPRGPEEPITDNGLPVFPVYFENDDDPLREWNQDSRMTFVPPADGEYCVRISDARGFQGADFLYHLTIRSPQPDFQVSVGGNTVAVHPGTGRELSFTAKRIDGYSGPVMITAHNLPPGFALSDPIIIEPEQEQAFGTLVAAMDAVTPTEEQVAAVRFTAAAQIGDSMVSHDCGGLKALKVEQNPQVRVIIQSLDQSNISEGPIPELTMFAGETLRAWVRVERNNFDGLVVLGKEDSGRNLPHGVIVDNIGLNGLMLLEGQTEREVFITAAKWVPETSRTFFLKSNIGGGITSFPVMLHVRHRETPIEGQAAVP
ncbi:MAG: hypothetical protein KDA96_00210 [Planctomycetaceae bacterium]|nr:hypothetical protein [Planctomycetaceae bacterium]